jgi:hypothetical protein
MPADYSQLGLLLVACTAIGLLAPLAAILITRALSLRSA